MYAQNVINLIYVAWIFNGFCFLLIHFFFFYFKVDKKDKTKRLRQDRQKVLDQLFNAFAKHEFYNIKDLVKLTQQPPVSKTLIFLLKKIYVLLNNLKLCVFFK